MSEPLDVVYLADIIYLTPFGPPVSALGIRGGVVVQTGTRDSAAEWGAVGQTHDFGSATITPGLIDAHSHAVSAGANRRGVDLSACTSLADVIIAVTTQPAEPDCQWQLGWSLDPNLFGGQPPDNRFLSACSGRPIFLKMADGHSAIANTDALSLAGVTGRETFASYSMVVCDSAGTPNGLLLEEEALDLIRRHVPPLTPHAQAAALLEVLRAMASTGLTTLSLLDLNLSSLLTLAMLEEQGELPLRLRCSPVFEPGVDVASELERVSALQSRKGRRWSVEGVKFVLDGTVDNGTAWLEQPDACGDSTKSTWLDIEQFRVAFRELARRGISTATHAIGDAAIREAVTAIASLTDAERAAAPHRIEHIETMPKHLLDAFAQSGAIASMQPTHSTLYVWPDHQDEWSRRLGTTRAQVNGFRFRDLVDAGVTVALGSDWPVAPYDPRGVIADAQLRRPHNKVDRGQTFPHQSLTPQMAIAGYTTAAARAIGWQDRVGSLEVGMSADVTVFAEDPLAVCAENVALTSVIATSVDGVVMWH